ncbi:DUF2171 domain-containing protein [Sphingomonas sp. Leaf412]|uniref:DUF2171 domain-containing protein n=1 Tax=Sphingomonas sp. Leaf412 TaxID=1736370 RepID=UPI0009E941E7|nr:DUF2171 domain-containing protein [Sphingomonas sp. Leaf412]
MGYERYPRGTDEQRDAYGRRDAETYGRDSDAGRSYGYPGGSPGARDADDGDRTYGGRDYGHSGYGRSDYGQSNYGQSGYGQSGYGQSGYARSGYGQSNDDRGATYGARNEQGRPGYGRYDGDRAQGGGYGRGDFGQQRDRYSSGDHGRDDGARSHGRDDQRFGQQRQRDGGRDYGRQPQGYDYDDRGFLARAGDEVRSWFGDEDAERRREADSRYDERYYKQQDRHHRDSDYGSWRSTQIAALDRDYDEYRQENRSRFENEFTSWRSNRQTQRQSLDQVKEHAEVVGSDGSHVGTVDKVRDDRILLTKTDKDADGRHHSIPSSWLQSVADDKVTLSKTADEAKRRWRDEEQNQALFRYGDGQRPGITQGGATNLNRSFSGTYDDKK